MFVETRVCRLASVWRAASVIAAVVSFGVACRAPAVAREDVADPASLRTEVLAQIPPLAGRADYAVDDPEVIDPCIAFAQQQTVATHADLVRSAVACVKTALTKSDGLTRIGKKIEARYASPTIARTGDTVTIDVGVLPGPLTELRGQTLVGDGPFHDRGQWSTAEVVKALRAAMAAHPDANQVVARALLLQRWGKPTWTYTFDLHSDRLRVNAESRPDEVYLSETLQGELANVTSLHTSALKANRL